MNTSTIRSTSLPQSDLWTPHPVRIRNITRETEDVRTYELQFAEADLQRSFCFEPGQFNMLYVPGVGEAAVSISGRSQIGGPLLHTVRAVGNVTNALARLTVGETLGLRGPFGSSWPMEKCADQHVIVITGGIGLAPLRPALYHIMDRRSQVRSVTLLYGARTPADRLYPHEFADWNRAGLAIEQTVDRCGSDWQGHIGFATLMLDRHEVSDPANTQVLMCGPEIMMRYSAVGAIKKGIPLENIWVSLERNMNCAVGFCGHCQLGPAFICKDGPVLRYDRIESFLAVRGF